MDHVSFSYIGFFIKNYSEIIFRSYTSIFIIYNLEL